MDYYGVTDSLMDRLDLWGMRGKGAGTPALHGMGAGCVGGETAHPATATSGGGDRAPMGNSGKGRGTRPRQFTGGRSVNSKTREGDFGEPFHSFVDDTVTTMATRNGRIVRARPFLAVITGGKGEH